MHSPKKRKDGLKDSLDRVLFAPQLEFLKILVPRLRQNLSNLNNVPENQNNFILYVINFLES